MQAGVDGLLRDKARPPHPAAGITEQAVQLTLSHPPGQRTHWTAPMTAKAMSGSVRSAQRIWGGHRLQPRRMRRLKLSNDPRFARKVGDIVGLYLDPPAGTRWCWSTRRPDPGPRPCPAPACR